MPEVLVFAETKLNESHTDPQFYIENYYKPSRKDFTSNSGGIIEFIKKGVVRKPLQDYELKTFESICSEITINKVKYCLLSFYRTERGENKNLNIKRFFKELAETVSKRTARYDNIILMGVINIGSHDKKSPGFENLRLFKNSFGFSNLLK